MSLAVGEVCHFAYRAGKDVPGPSGGSVILDSILVGTPTDPITHTLHFPLIARRDGASRQIRTSHPDKAGNSWYSGRDSPISLRCISLAALGGVNFSSRQSGQ